MNNGILKITTKLIKKDFDKGIREMKLEAQEVTEELENGDVALGEMGAGVGAVSAGMIALLAVVAEVMAIVFAISKAWEGLAESNDEFAKKVERVQTAMSNLGQGIKIALGNLMAPVFNRIIDFLYRMLAYINAITEAWFHYSIFTKKTDNDIKSQNKAAKELKKTLAGFDTATVLSQTGTGAVGGVGAIPEQEITFPDVELPEWVTWIIDHKDEVITAIEAIVFAISAATGNVPLAIAMMVKLIKNHWQPVKDFLLKIGGWLNEHLVVPVANALKPLTDNIKIAFNNIVTIFRNAWTLIKTIFTPAANWFKDIFTKVAAAIRNAITPLYAFFGNVWFTIKKIFSTAATTIKNAFVQSFKAVFNALMSTMEKIMNAPIKAINKLTDVVNKIPGVELSKIDTFSLPRLAKGGIVNNPGAGVLMGSYIAGERGPEAVLPLTDDTLQRLANMIPITIDMTNKLDSRVLSRNLIQVQNENRFSRNGG